jgi:hypothetical protein
VRTQRPIKPQLQSSDQALKDLGKLGGRGSKRGLSANTDNFVHVPWQRCGSCPWADGGQRADFSYDIEDGQVTLYISPGPTNGASGQFTFALPDGELVKISRRSMRGRKSMSITIPEKSLAQFFDWGKSSLSESPATPLPQATEEQRQQLTTVKEVIQRSQTPLQREQSAARCCSAERTASGRQGGLSMEHLRSLRFPGPSGRARLGFLNPGRERVAGHRPIEMASWWA